MESTNNRPESQQQLIARLRKRNKKLERVYNEYKRVCRNEEERIKELNCLYQVAQCVVIETDMNRALEKIARIIPNGWQHTKKSCARITVKDSVYLSANSFESNVFQNEDIFLKRQNVGKIEVFYDSSLESDSNNPFLIEERNLLKGIANIISFYLVLDRKLETPDSTVPSAIITA